MVVDWMVYYKKEYFILNQEDKIEEINISLSSEKTELLLTVDKQVIDLSSIYSFWYRRGGLVYDMPLIKTKYRYGNKFISHLSSEWKALSEFIHVMFESKKSLGSYQKECYNNKLKNLLIAVNCGLMIPETLVISNKEKIAFCLQNRSLITKSLNEDIYFNLENKVEFANFGPMVVEATHLEKMNETFFPTLLQNYIEKLYELRIFILHEKIYSSAIFSQSNPMSVIDSRIQDTDNPVRMVPYQLPEKIESCLIEYMRMTKQNTASIDMIVNKKNEYIFLESNHVGQFGYLSYNCNYHLEHEIAHYLIS
jgi:ATP-GRASP peptide maturase of grasp-with-spasm system